MRPSVCARTATGWQRFAAFAATRYPGHEAFYITAPNIYIDRPVEDLLKKHFPGDYPVADHIKGDVSPVDCSKAERLLGWKPRYNWDGNEF